MNDLALDMLSGASFDGWGLFGGFLFSMIGLWMFRDGKRREQYTVKYCGLALMIYPYFVDGWKANWGIGAMICAFAYFTWNGI